MADIAVETFAKVDLKDALVVVAFPTTGSASSIAAHYLLRHLDLPLVGHLLVPEMAGIMSVEDGRATAALRIYGGETKCTLGKGCPRLYLVLTELPLPPLVVLRVADAVLAWARAGAVHLVLALEGVVRSEGDPTPDVYCTSGKDDVLKELTKAGIPVMGRALIGGVTSHLVLAGPARSVRTGALLVEANRDFPDGHAAAALITALNKVLPDVRIDPKPLLKEAEELEAEIRNAQQLAQASLTPGTASQFI